MATEYEVSYVIRHRNGKFLRNNSVTTTWVNHLGLATFYFDDNHARTDIEDLAIDNGNIYVVRVGLAD
jgi:hypothetical protein